MQHHAPIPELVREALKHQRLLIRHDAGGLFLFVEVLEQVVVGVLVEARVDDGGIAFRFPAECAKRQTEFVWPAQRVARPERQATRVARRGANLHLVAGDVLNPPTRCAEGEHVTDAGLVDHLLVEFTDSSWGCSLFLVSNEENAEHAPVRDGAGVGHGDALRAGAGFEGGAVEDCAGTQFREVSGGVDTDDQVNDRVEDFAGEITVGPGAGNGLVPVIQLQVFHRDGGNGLLGKHIQWTLRGVQLLDEPLPHTGNSHCCLH